MVKIKMARKNSVWDKVAIGLSLVGGLNWGLVGIGGFIGSNLNLVNLLFGGIPVIENVVYLAVGVSAGYLGIKTLM